MCTLVMKNNFVSNMLLNCQCYVNTVILGKELGSEAKIPQKWPLDTVKNAGKDKIVFSFDVVVSELSISFAP